MRALEQHDARHGERRRIIRATTWSCPFCSHVWKKTPPAFRSKCPGCGALVEGRGWVVKR